MPLSREVPILGLFMRPLDAVPMKFSLGRGRPRHDEVKRMIEEGGGILETPKKPDIDKDRIRLGDEVIIIEKDNVDVFNVQYIYDCCNRNELLRNLADYRLNKKSYFLPYDPFEILIGVKNWWDLQRNEGEECSDIEEDDSILVTNPAENLKVGRRPYSKRDQVEILKYIIEHGAFKQLKGKTLWQDMERSKKVCKGQRTWQSMKEHFRRQILPSLNKFDFILNEDLKIQILTGGELDVCCRHEDEEEGVLHLRGIRRRSVKKNDGMSSKSFDKSRFPSSSSSSRKPSSDDATTNDSPAQRLSEKRDAENILEKDDRSILRSVEKSAPLSSSSSSRKSSNDDAIVDKSPVSSQKSSEKKSDEARISPDISVEKSADEKKKSEETDRRPKRKRNSAAPPLHPPAASNDENRRKSSDNNEPDILTALSLKRSSSPKNKKKLWNWNDPEGAIPYIHSPFVVVDDSDFVGGLSSSTRSSSPIADKEARTTTRKKKKKKKKKRRRSKSRYVVLNKIGDEVIPDLDLFVEKAVSSSSDDSEKNKNHELKITKVESLKSRSRFPYTKEEDMKLIRFIRDNKLYGMRKGVYIWKLMEEREVLPGRTWQSMKSRFINVSKDFTKLGVSLEDMEESVINESSDEEEGSDFLPDRKKKPYKRKEDRKILDFIVENQRFSEVGGMSLWELMEARGILPGRTAQSMKERFRKRILPRIDQFDYAKSIIDQFRH